MVAGSNPAVPTKYRYRVSRHRPLALYFGRFLGLGFFPILYFSRYNVGIIVGIIVGIEIYIIEIYQHIANSCLHQQVP